jgi:hypothetical protein
MAPGVLASATAFQPWVLWHRSLPIVLPSFRYSYVRTVQNVSAIRPPQLWLLLRDSKIFYPRHFARLQVRRILIGKTVNLCVDKEALIFGGKVFSTRSTSDLTFPLNMGVKECLPSSKVDAGLGP